MLAASVARLQRTLSVAIELVETRFILRWTLANMVGWSAGMYIGSLALSIIGGLPGVLVAGGIMGAVAGAMQWLASDVFSRRWIVLSAIGGLAAALPVFLATFTLIVGRGFGLAIMGAMFGLCFGWVQTIALRGDGTFVWIIVNIVAGGLCGMLTLMPLSVPVCLSPGPLIFGLLTGWVLYALRDELID